MTKLTKKTIEAIAPSNSDKIVFDSDLAGFGVRVSPGGRKTFIVQFRSSGRTRRMSLGKFGVVTVDQSRRKAKEILGIVAVGGDPSRTNKRDKNKPTFALLAGRFLEEHVRDHCKPRTFDEYERLLNRQILPTFGKMHIADIKRAEIAAFHIGMRATPYQANRALAILSKMFQLAEIWQLRPEGTNPCQLVKKFPEKNKERYLSKTELARLLSVLNQRFEERVETRQVTAAFKFLLFTGCRVSEVQHLKWNNVKPGALELSDSKTGARRIPISKEAEAIIISVPQAVHTNYVFWANGPRGFITDFQKPWRRIREQAGLEDVRIHDLRHTFASLAVQQGVSLQLVGKLLGHSQLQTTMRYAHLAETDVRNAANTVADVVNLATSAEDTADRSKTAFVSVAR